MEIDLDLSELLGAERESSSQVLSVYIPNKDREGNVFDAEPWVKEVTEILFRMGSGATVMPPCNGVTPDKSEEPMWETTVIAYTFITDAFPRYVSELRAFLHRFGRETNQERVGLELTGGGEGWFFRIKEFDGA